MESSSVRSSAPESQLISRRTLVRAGATAAWTVPLVQVVAAAPALATSGKSSDLTAVISVAQYANATTLHVVGSVTTADLPSSGLQLTIQLPTGVTASAATVTSGSSWSAPTAPSSFGKNTVQFTSTGTGTSRSFDFNISISSAPEGDVVAIPFASNQGAVTNGGYHLSGFSSKASLSLTGFTATSYLPTDASQLNVKGTVSSGSSATTTALTLKVSIPAGKYGSQPTVSTAPSGWDGAPPGVAVASGGGWDVTFTSKGQLAASATKNIDAVIQLNDTDAAKKYAGSTFQIDVVATPGNGSDATTQPTVAVARNSTLAVTGLGGTGSPSFTSSDKKTYKASLAVKNNGPKLISNIVVTVKLSGAAKTLDSWASGWTNITASTEKTTWRFQRDASVSILPGSATTVDPSPQFTFKDAAGYTATYGASADNATTLTAP